ncbi:helix-turn-helix domain-containing protein [Paraburkholderia sp. UCT31]|uniref:helix-turn-helix domain-containing protein n=1 Tax=Paraburkholderia sp. UCT31 TaxID=2615209 RepID=UPI0016554181|nr:helix-turn-helix transcriptional regulator [Paraburkholderia sp. UCT31]
MQKLLAPGSTRQMVAARVKSLRLLRGMVSQRILAEVVGCAKSYISEIETARANVGLDTLDDLSAALRVDVVSFFSETIIEYNGLGLLARQRVTRNLERLRVAANLEYTDVAAQGGLRVEYVEKIENEGRNLSLDRLEALAVGLGETPDALLKKARVQEPFAVRAARAKQNRLTITPPVWRLA